MRDFPGASPIRREPFLQLFKLLFVTLIALCNEKIKYTFYEPIHGGIFRNRVYA